MTVETGGQDRDKPASPSVTAIAFYLPQYHPVPENDEWWGPGFTEWTNVAAARPLFPGHHQPNLPGELGFYDLRLPETREAQAVLAAEHGVTAFCYWHYWFGDGRRILERPFAEVLRTGSPSFPFCLGWANQSWSGVWHGAPDRVLAEQCYPGEADDRAHFEILIEAFHDPRYLRVDGRPLLLVYNPKGHPSPGRFADDWRRYAEEAGLPGLFLVGAEWNEWRPSDSGFDAMVATQVTPPSTARRRAQGNHHLDWAVGAVTRRSSLLPGIYSYEKWSPFVPHLLEGDDLVFPVVMPNWDNTPRSGRRGFVFVGSSPARFGDQVRRAIDLVRGRSPEHRIVFVKSWNEWAEGNYLEPDRRNGRAYLEAFRDAVGGSSSSTSLDR